MDLIERFRRHLATLSIPGGQALIAVSGGPDSVALLDLLLRTAESHGRDLVVVHYDHGIHPESPMVAAHVRTLADARGIPFESGRGDLGPGASETAARDARYAFLEGARERLGAGSIFLAHHADDQAETVLMRALAGSGPAGLAGMDAVSGRLVRPLLPFTRSELAQYVQARALPVWHDPANSNVRHLRVWLRSRVLPMLREQVPDVESRLLDVARHSRRNREAWDAVLDLVPDLDVTPEAEGISVAADGVRRYDSSLAEALMFALARRAGCRLGPVRAARLLGWLEGAKSGSELQLSKGWRAELSFGRLRFVQGRSPAAPRGPFSIAGRSGEGVWGPWRIMWSRGGAPQRQERVALTAWFSTDSLTVRGWEAGEKLRPLAGIGRRLIVKCFQDARVPRSRREGWPVVAGGDEVVWIPGVCRSDALVPPSGSEALRVDAELA
jgi:tRNA(Ile)-lysidine synthase